METVTYTCDKNGCEEEMDEPFMTLQTDGGEEWWRQTNQIRKFFLDQDGHDVEPDTFHVCKEHALLIMAVLSQDETEAEEDGEIDETAVMDVEEVEE